MTTRKPPHACIKSQRFPSTRTSGSGVDPLGSFREFIKSDITQNIDMHRDTVKRQDNLESRKDCPAVGTTTVTKGLPVPRPQSPAQSVSLATDHISVPRPESQERVRAPPRFSKSAQSGEGWSPQVHPSGLRNQESTPYNPITCEPLQYSVHTGDARRRKGVTEFADKQNPFGDRQNPAYREAIAQDPTVFRRRTGVFSHMYDAAAQQGYISKPFDGKRDSLGKAPFK